MALQCLAVPLAIFLTRPEKVQRSDGSKVKIVRQDSWRAEFRALWEVCRRKEVNCPDDPNRYAVADSMNIQILLLLPVFWASYFNQYEGSTLNISNLLS